MKKTDRRRLKVRAWVAKWRPRLLLGEWHVDLNYSKRCHHSDDHDDYQVLAEAHVNVPYLKVQICIFPAFFDAPEDVQESTIVHELCHVITQPMLNIANQQHRGVLTLQHQISDTLETLTQRITNIAFWDRGKKR